MPLYFVYLAFSCNHEGGHMFTPLFCICDCDYIDRDYELTEAIETHSKYVQLLEPGNKVEATLKKNCDVPDKCAENNACDNPDVCKFCEPLLSKCIIPKKNKKE